MKFGVKEGQVYREKDDRYLDRRVKVDGFFKFGVKVGRFKADTWYASVKSDIGTKTYISCENLSKRWEIVSKPKRKPVDLPAHAEVA